MIPDEIVARVREATDIATVISRTVRLKRAGNSLKGLCPFHGEKTPSFNVNAQKQIFKCFGCGEGGDVFSFLMKHEKLNFNEAVRNLAMEAGIEIPETDGRDAEEVKREAREKEALLELLKLAALWFRRNLLEGKEAEPARAYVKKRNLSEAIQEKFFIGYSPRDPQALERAASSKGYTRAQMLQAGLLGESEGRTYSRFRGRLMFAIEDMRGAIVGFGGRILGEGEPKYLNSPETRLFSKGRLLYAFPQAKDAVQKKKRILICEGYMDALACQQAGVEEAVAVLGTALTEDHARAIKRYAGEALLVFDTDAAGIRAARRGCEMLLKAGLEPKVVRLGGAKDPDEYIQAKGREAFDRELENAGDALSFLADAAVEASKAQKGAGELSLHERAKVVQSLFPLLSRYGTAMETEAQLARLCERLKLPLEAAREDFKSFEAAPERFAGATGFWDEPKERSQPRLEEGLEEAEEEEKRAPTALQRCEGELLALLACHPELISEAKLDLETPDFSKPEHAAAGRLLWKHSGPLVGISDDGSEDFSLGEPLLSVLAMESGDRFPRPAEHLRKLLLQRSRLQQEQRRAELKKKIEASAEVNLELLKEKQLLDRAIDEMKKLYQES